MKLRKLRTKKFYKIGQASFWEKGINCFSGIDPMLGQKQHKEHGTG